eukprot:CAMPEP_0182459672 /NCGR_PEP_ID=MMETSP1319-20130603/4744_1 /TAXON_ID=172717 /ORGANISM="Bolidomonas pacifica, Strain RCC208" /LENGTH=229 /DNA_ID=CAMNT_0024658637 /DNA_START=48 /DNA_END=737 /DNA_ORIENTATION=+
MKLLSLLALLPLASAFSPSPLLSSPPSSALSASSLDGAIGLTVETGRKCPPLGAKILEGTGPEALAWFENAELKHGRIAMVATIGFMVQKYGVHFPLYLGPSGSNVFHPADDAGWYLSQSAGIKFADIAAMAPLDAIKAVPLAGWLQILFVAGWSECVAYQRQYNEGGRVPGDYGYDPLGFTKRAGGLSSPELTSLRVKEIKNGRVAMLAISAWVANEAIPGALPVWHP